MREPDPAGGRRGGASAALLVPLAAALPQADPQAAELGRRRCERRLSGLGEAAPPPGGAAWPVGRRVRPLGRDTPPEGGVSSAGRRVRPAGDVAPSAGRRVQPGELSLPLAERVRRRLAHRFERGGGPAAQAQLAAELHMSERSLRRLLAAEGVRYSALADQTAAEAARRLLARGHTVESVAAALGYSGPSSFTHAFKRWTGTPPGRFARAARGPDRSPPPDGGRSAR